MTCFLDIWQLHLRKKSAHAASGLIHCIWHRLPLLTEMGGAHLAGQLALEKAEGCSWSCPLPVVLPALGVPSACGAAGAPCCCVSPPSSLHRDRAYRPKQDISWGQNQGRNAHERVSRKPRGHRAYTRSCQEDDV